MCRLFGMSGGPNRVAASFWLLQAPDSLVEQSRREPDGTGLGTYDANGLAHIDKQPLAAYRDDPFLREARDVRSHTFVAHIRFASTGGLVMRNTHPFEQQGRLFAHNGVVEDLDRLEARLGAARALVQGDTDSERMFALITQETDRRAGDLGAGIAAAVNWMAENLSILAMNFVLITATEMWALRYPDTHELHVLERGAGGGGHQALEHSSSLGIRVHSSQLADDPAVVIASELMDSDPDWRLLNSGELLHVHADLRVSSNQVLTGPPAHPLTLADLKGPAARSQAASGEQGGR